MPSITDSIGRVLGDRYRLVTALGTGASAHVYLADDVSLHRGWPSRCSTRPWPATPPSSSVPGRGPGGGRPQPPQHPPGLRLGRGGRRAVPGAGVPGRRQPPPGLRHRGPALAGAGGPGRAGGDRRARLRPPAGTGPPGHQAGQPALRRRTAPPDRRLRLARALAEASWTEPDGAILGTARYAAPEQVEDWVLDGKADVYALALVLYEGVTGETPFIGDTTVATLMARVGALLPEHDALGPLNDVLVWAAAPEPSERFDAAQFSLRLAELADALPEPRPLPGGGPRPGRRARRPGQGHGPADPARRLRRTRVPTPPSSGCPAVAGARSPGQEEQATQVGSAVGVHRRPSPGADAAGPGSPPWPWWWRPWSAAGVALAAQTGLFTPSHPVPALVGKTVPQAVQAVKKDQFTVRTTGHAASITIGPGLIVSQQPAPRSAGQADDGQGGVDHRGGGLDRSAAGGHSAPSPRSPPAPMPCRR